MTKIPNSETAYVPLEKITKYLLDLTSQDGHSKARFFLQMGFSVDDPELFAAALANQAVTGTVFRTKVTKYGTRYDMIGELSCPNGRVVTIRSGWFINLGATAPRLITAFPG